MLVCCGKYQKGGSPLLLANLYVDKIDLDRYFSPAECRVAGFGDCRELTAALKAGRLRPEDCSGLSPTKRYALSLALRAQEVLPPVQSLEFPRPLPPELYEINAPDAGAPVLVTGNSEFTLAVLTGLLALTVSPFFLLQVDCRGDTADMAMIYRSFTPQRLDQALETHGLKDRISHRRLIIPGVLAPLKEELAGYLPGWEIVPGPICAGELPLFMGENWQPPPG
jgi:CO dehydrogenase/acetyl-CoA synthase gamma subunit (corrinoid Fe-S protein)